MKYEVTIKNDFGEPNEMFVNTPYGYESALTNALDSHYDDESEIIEIIIRKVEN